MKTILLLLSLLAGYAKQTESKNGVYYPNAYEVECFTDGCLSDLVKGGYDENAY